MSTKGILRYEGKDYELPVFEGTEGERALDIRTLRATTGLITLDNGFLNTGSCISKITFLDGEKGILHYRGYPIEQLAEKSNFIEVTCLLNFGELPTENQLSRFRKKMASFGVLPEGVPRIIESFPRNAHPMGVISAATSSLCSFYPEYLKTPLSEEDRERGHYSINVAG